jgi:isoquinoline 1-oxidoreductase beta subunit
MKLRRRGFVCAVTLSGLAWVTGSARAVAGGAGHAPAQPAVEDWALWLVIDAAGGITLFHKVTDLGQGTPSSLARVIAGQLGIDPERITLRQAPVREPYLKADDDYSTSGSSGIRTSFAASRRLGATARAVLVQAAALRWQVGVAECTVRAGSVVHEPSARTLRFSELAEAAASLPVPPEVHVDERPRPWPAAAAGRSRADESSLVDGSAVFGVDVQLPGLSTAAIVHCPIPGGTVRAVDASPALLRTGVFDVVTLDDAVAVVATDFWTASDALRRVRVEWSAPPTLPDTRVHRQALLAAVGAGEGLRSGGPRGVGADEHRRASEQGLASARRRLDATYYVPWAAHMTMEPQNATARVSDGRAELWLPTQNQALVRSTVATQLNLPADAVTVHTTRAGGGFGRRLEVDVAREATLIARRSGRPVKLVWSREQDLQNDYFRPAAAARLRAGLDANGGVSSIVVDVATPSILASSTSSHELPPGEPDFTALMGLQPGYSLPAASVGWTRVEAGLRSGWWRSVGCAANGFFLESFIDELAATTGVRPLACRRALLAHDPRATRLLQRLEQEVEAATPAARGWFWGHAWFRYSGTRVGHAVAVSRAGGRRIRIERILVVVDCGIVVDPHFARSQVEGGVVWGLSACRFGAVTFEQGRPGQSNFHDYPVARARHLPPIDVFFIDSSEEPGGLGEESVPGTAPALANAIFAATGRRLRELPFRAEEVEFADSSED